MMLEQNTMKITLIGITLPIITEIPRNSTTFEEMFFVTDQTLAPGQGFIEEFKNNVIEL